MSLTFDEFDYQSVRSAEKSTKKKNSSEKKEQIWNLGPML